MLTLEPIPGYLGQRWRAGNARPPPDPVPGYCTHVFGYNCDTCVFLRPKACQARLGVMKERRGVLKGVEPGTFVVTLRITGSLQ